MVAALVLSIVVVSIGVAEDEGPENGHFIPKGKLPSKFTVELQKKWREMLPFDDERDFEEAKSCFIASPSYRQIKAAAGHVARDIGKYDFCSGSARWWPWSTRTPMGTTSAVCAV